MGIAALAVTKRTHDYGRSFDDHDDDWKRERPMDGKQCITLMTGLIHEMVSGRREI